MDPLTALSISAAVVQFCDFGYRLLKNAHEISKSASGEVTEYIELSAVSCDLTALVDDVECKLGQYKSMSGETAQHIGSTAQSGLDEIKAHRGSTEDVFFRLCRECRETQHELQTILRKLRGQGHSKLAVAASSWMAALRAVVAASDIEALAERLSQLRQQIMLALLSLLLGESQKTGVGLQQFARQQAKIMATLDRIDDTTKQFSSDIVDLVDVATSKDQSESVQMARYVLSERWTASEYDISSVVDKHKDHANIERVSRALFFESIGNREAQIPKKHGQTFEWIFQQPPISENGSELWASFPIWLKSDSAEIYWITGKPGAGKYTLLKFIAGDKRFENFLRSWANGGCELMIIRFFSWNAAVDGLQKSREGLLRTLLLEAIEQKPELVATLFPSRWFLLSLFGGNAKLPPPRYSELASAFKNLLEATRESLRLVVVVDGLDEFGDDHHQLIKLFRTANGKTGVKICASSRPWNVFKDEYARNPMLQLEKLTREDVKLFMEENLASSPGYQDFKATNPQQALEIITDVVNKAQGVFLWVSIVSGLLEDSLREGARAKGLQDIIEGLPEEVSDLFSYIWKRTSDRYRAEASRYLQILKVCKGVGLILHGLTLWFADEEIPLDPDRLKATRTYLDGVAKSLERMLMSRTGGLLELSKDSRDDRSMVVDFMHRTASDWVRDNWGTIILPTDPNFDPYLCVLKGEALRIATDPTPGQMRGHILDLSRVARRVKDDEENGVRIVRIFDCFARQLHSRSTMQNNGTRPSDGITAAQGCASDDFGFLGFSITTEIPVSSYIKHRAVQDPALFCKICSRLDIVGDIILGELSHGNRSERWELLDYLLRHRFGPKSLSPTKERIERKKEQLSLTEVEAPGETLYLELVVEMLKAHDLSWEDGNTVSGWERLVLPFKRLGCLRWK